MWTSNIKIWIRTESEWREAVAFVKDATGWRPTLGFIRITVNPYTQVSIRSLESLTAISVNRAVFREVPIRSLDPLTTISVNRAAFREVPIRSLPQVTAIIVNEKPW